MQEVLSPEVANYIGKKNSIHMESSPIATEINPKDFEKVSPELLRIAENVAKISGTWNPVEIFTADQSSIDGERQKLFEAYYKGDTYNPTLTYTFAKGLDLEPGRKKLHDELKKLRSFGKKEKSPWKFWDKTRRPGKNTLDRPTRLFRTALYYKIKDDLATCDLALGIKTGNEDLTAKALKQKYPGTDQNLYDTAVAEYIRLTHEGDSRREYAENSDKGLFSTDQIQWLKDKKYTPDEQVAAFKWALNELGILMTAQNPRGFQVRFTDKVTGIDVRSKSTEGSTVFLPSDRSIEMSAYKILTLIMHEIVGHARQDVNGEATYFLGGGKLKIDNEQLYEGLGLRYEFETNKRLYGIDDSAPSPLYTLATRMAERGASFHEIFNDQVERRLRIRLKKPDNLPAPVIDDLEPDQKEGLLKNAWLGTYRVMRGHLDMTNKKSFAMSKDLGYLRGFMMDKQLRDNGLGYINEEGVISQGALAMIAELDTREDQLPIKYKDLALQYFVEVLMPQMPEDVRNQKAEEIKKAYEESKKAWEKAVSNK